MGKKNLNPADSFRKAQRKKELKKNKADRSKARDFSLVKKDTTDLENVIKELEEGRSDPEKLAELKAELENINRKKAEYVEEHPEQRRLVYRRRREGEPEPELNVAKKRNLFKKNGLPRHPERSIYYDAVMNPFGVAPPGYPYLERALLPGEVDSEAEMDDDDEDEDDIPLPPGLPPGTEEVQDDDDIPMPDAPPPGQEGNESSPPPLPPTGSMPAPPSQGFPGQFGNGMFVPPPPPLPHGFQPPHGMTSPPPPPPGFPLGMPQFPPPHPAGPPIWHGNMPPPPPPGFPQYPNTNFPPFPPNAFPPPPPKFLPRHQSAASMQDPLSTIPHQTFQAHRASQLSPPHPSLPPNPSGSSSSVLPQNPSLPPKPTAAAKLAAATVVAAPELRDLKKEATSFVPSALKRKKAAAAPAETGSKLNAAPILASAAPGVDDDGESVGVRPVRPDLISALKGQFGPAAPKPTARPNSEMKSDYDKFVDEMGDILGNK